VRAAGSHCKIGAYGLQLRAQRETWFLTLYMYNILYIYIILSSATSFAPTASALRMLCLVREDRYIYIYIVYYIYIISFGPTASAWRTLFLGLGGC
jgi:hypothetical protein